MTDKLNLDNKNSLNEAYDLYVNGDIEGQEYLDFMVKFNKRRKELEEIRKEAGYNKMQ